jgi:prepilin-type processing-associated H-X9-DG protein
MNEQQKPNPTGRFQFGMKYLIAAPVPVALFFGIGTWLGSYWAFLFLLFVVVLLGIYLATTTLERLTIVAIVGLLAAILLPAGQTGYTPHSRSECSNNLKQIALALHNYHNVHGSFPPAYIADKNGRPMHSWRVLILPFLEHGGLYEQYDFNEPWNGPNNRKLADIPIAAFNCPADNKEPSTTTNYLAVVGPDTAWTGSESTSLADFAGDKGTTLLVVEVADSGIHWMEPRDLHVLQMALTINPPAGQGISSHHLGGAIAAFADGHIEYLPETVSPEDLRAMLTWSGGEPIDIDDAMNRGAD